MNKKVFLSLAVLAVLSSYSYGYAADGFSLAEPSNKPRTVLSSVVSIDHSASPYTMTTEDMLLIDSSGGAVTINLPDVTTNAGLTYIFKKTSSDTNVITIDPDVSQTIDGQLTFSLSGQFESVEIVSNGTEWKIIDFSPTAIYEANSSNFNLSTTGYSSSEYAQMTGNSLTLPPGTWQLTGAMLYNTGGSAATSYMQANYYEANGNNTSSAPTALGASAFTVLSDSGGLAGIEMAGNVNVLSLAMPTRVVRNSSSATVYLVSRVGFTVAGTASTTAHITARRIF